LVLELAHRRPAAFGRGLIIVSRFDFRLDLPDRGPGRITDDALHVEHEPDGFQVLFGVTAEILEIPVPGLVEVGLSPERLVLEALLLLLLASLPLAVLHRGTRLGQNRGRKLLRVVRGGSERRRLDGRLCQRCSFLRLGY